MEATTESEWEMCRNFDVKTKYVRTVFRQQFVGDPHSLGSTITSRSFFRWTSHTKNVSTDNVFAIETYSQEQKSNIVFLTWMTQSDFDAWSEPGNAKALRDLVPTWDIEGDANTITSTSSSRFSFT